MVIHAWEWSSHPQTFLRRCYIIITVGWDLVGRDELLLEYGVFSCSRRAHSPFAAPTISISKVSSLEHEIGYDTMENTSLVMQRFALVSYALLAGAEGTKILHSFGDGITKKTKDDAPALASLDCDIEEYLFGNGLGTIIIIIFLDWNFVNERQERERDNKDWNQNSEKKMVDP